jgi:DNA-binding MarR family transcriptional regulator
MTRKQDPQQELEQAPILDGLPGYLIRRCHQISLGLFHDELKEFNLTPVQFATLRTLYDLGSMDQVTLAGHAALDFVTMGEVARRLEGRGMLIRQVNPRDRRARLLQLTPIGVETVEAMMPGIAHMQERLLAPLSAAEKETLMTLLRRVAKENNALSRAPKKVRPRPEK